MDLIEGHLIQILDEAKSGLAASDMAKQFVEQGAPQPAERTLKRRLAKLVQEGRIARVGKGPATRYFKIGSEQSASQSAFRKGADELPAAIPLSIESQEVQRQVTRPLAARRLVGYNERLLRQYSPAHDYYLDTQSRDHLWKMGQNVATASPAGTFARKIFERLLIDLAWSSSRLEGNTYSRLDTERLLKDGERAAGTDARETQMILNHKKAIEMLVDGAETIGFNRVTILNLHASLSENLLGNPDDEGCVRRSEVGITGTTYIPMSIPQKLEELFDLMLAKATAITDPFEQAFFIMVHLPYLQPFIDVNKRTSRLAANIPFIKANLCPLSFVDVPEQIYVEANLGVYELNNTTLLKDLFRWAYERSATRYRLVEQSLPQPDPLRLRYRQQLGAIVHELVTREAPSQRNVLDLTSEDLGVAEEDRDSFVKLVEASMAGLHEGNFARYGLKPSQFRTWVARKGDIGRTTH